MGRGHGDAALIGPLFAEMASDHPERVAQFLADVLGGLQEYSRQRGGHATINHRVGRRQTEARRKRWMRLISRELLKRRAEARRQARMPAPHYSGGGILA